VDVRLITDNGVERRKADELEALLDGPGLLWIDVAHWDAEIERVAEKRLELHPRAMHDCSMRNPVPKLHLYPEQTFLVLHAPERGARGHVHYIELDQFIGPNWLITVHGPMNPVVPLDAAYVETRAVARRLENGRLRPTRACELSAALGNALTGRLREFLTELTQEVWTLERQVTGGHLGDPEVFLEELFGGAARAVGGAHDGRAEPRGVRADVSAVGVRAGRGGAAGRSAGSVPAARGDGRQPTRVPAKA
jgi:magnesium transporter